MPVWNKLTWTYYTTKSLCIHCHKSPHTKPINLLKAAIKYLKGNKMSITVKPQFRLTKTDRELISLKLCDRGLAKILKRQKAFKSWLDKYHSKNENKKENGE